MLYDYTILMNRLMDAEETRQISAYSWSMIRDMSKKVVENIAVRYENVKEGVEAIMGGRVLEYEGKRIFNEGRNEGFDEGRNKGFDEGRNKGFDEGRNKGRNEGENCMGRLMSILLDLGRMDDAKLASKDPEFRSLLYKEFQIA